MHGWHHMICLVEYYDKIDKKFYFFANLPNFTYGTWYYEILNILAMLKLSVVGLIELKLQFFAFERWRWVLNLNHISPLSHIVNWQCF